MKQTKPEPPQPKYNDDARNYLSDYLEITTPAKKEDGILHSLVYNEMFDRIDKHFETNKTKDDIIKLNHGDIYEYLRDWLDKKENAGHSAFTDDFISLVVYPYLKKLNKDENQLLVRLAAIELVVELQTVFKRAIEPPINKKSVVRALINHKHGTILNLLYKLDPEIKHLWGDLVMITSQGDEFQGPGYKPTSKVLIDFFIKLKRNKMVCKNPYEGNH